MLKIRPSEKFRCLLCEDVGEPHHFRTRGSGGSDESFNLMYLCRGHHSEIHRLGRSTFVEKYPRCEKFLLAHGWTKCELTLKWIHD